MLKYISLLRTGEIVAVKVQRPDIRTTVQTDLEILDDITRMMEANLSWAKTYQVRNMMKELSNSLLAELDYQTEGRNGERIAKQFQDIPEIVVPKIYWDYSTNEVLTIDYISGVKVNHIETLSEEGYNLKLIARRITDSMLQQILMEGFFMATPILETSIFYLEIK